MFDDELEMEETRSHWGVSGHLDGWDDQDEDDWEALLDEDDVDDDEIY